MFVGSLFQNGREHQPRPRPQPQSTSRQREMDNFADHLRSAVFIWIADQARELGKPAPKWREFLANYPRHKEAYLPGANRPNHPAGTLCVPGSPKRFEAEAKWGALRLTSTPTLRPRAPPEACGTFLMSLLRADSFGRCEFNLCQVVSGIRTLLMNYAILWNIMKVDDLFYWIPVDLVCSLRSSCITRY